MRQTAQGRVNKRLQQAQGLRVLLAKGQVVRQQGDDPFVGGDAFAQAVYQRTAQPVQTAGQR